MTALHERTSGLGPEVLSRSILACGHRLCVPLYQSPRWLARVACLTPVGPSGYKRNIAGDAFALQTFRSELSVSVLRFKTRAGTLITRQQVDYRCIKVNRGFRRIARALSPAPDSLHRCPKSLFHALSVHPLPRSSGSHPEVIENLLVHSQRNVRYLWRTCWY